MITRKLVALIILLISIVGNSTRADNRTIEFSAIPDWVNNSTVTLPETLPNDSIEEGTYFALIENQIKVDEEEPPEYYYHYAKLVINQQGVENASQLNIEFDPSYEALIFHSLIVRRDNQVIDKSQSAKFSVIQRETDLDNQLMDGRLTAHYILDDIRSGDIIEYSFSTIGDNPIYQGLFAYSKYIQWSVPVHQQKLRLLWGKDTPLNLVKLNTGKYVSKTKRENNTEYSLSLLDQPILTTNSGAPDWYDPYGAIIFAEDAEWSDIASWALPLYQEAIGSSKEVKAIADAIAEKFNDPRQRIVEALNIVQSQVRYFGIELGTNSHQPSPAAETLKRRYGDCKDKAVLFISILQQLGINSSPALVNTEKSRELSKYPPMVNAFNHVIVKVELDNETFWLDPTRQFQYGELSDIHQPNYHHALVIDKTTQNLEPMNDISDRSWVIIHSSFDLSKGEESPAQFKTTTEYIGLEAERQFSNIGSSGINSLHKDYIEFYQDYYGKIIPNEKLSVVQNKNEGKVITSENYKLLEFWEKDAEEKKHFANFYADSIRAYIPKPKQENRNSPFSISYPKNIKQTMDIQFPSTGWGFGDEELIENNQFFNFKYRSIFDTEKQILTLSYQLNLLTPYISDKDIKAYLAARENAYNTTTYGIEKAFSGATESEDGVDIYELSYQIYLLLLIAGLAFSIINWRIEHSRNGVIEESVFFPVSLVKFFILNIVTFGIYSAYWFYRNWLFIKSKEDSQLMPIARGIFNKFWYYPLYLELTKDSDIRYGKNKVINKPIAGLLAIVFFTLYILINKDSLLIPILIIEPLLLIPLINYINHIKVNKQQAYSYNSQWKIRHTILCVIFSPYLLYIYGTTVNLLPGDSVVSGDKIWSHDIKFMQRQKLFPVNERLEYFYSDAFFNIRSDGNGFTKSHVFTYWKDENNLFYTESARLSDVQNIKITYSKTQSEISSATITRKDGSEFVLYIGSTDHKDKVFADTLKSQWRIAQEP